MTTEEVKLYLEKFIHRDDFGIDKNWDVYFRFNQSNHVLSFSITYKEYMTYNDERDLWYNIIHASQAEAREFERKLIRGRLGL